MKQLIGMTTVTIVFLVLMLGPSVEAYRESPQDYSWVDVNGEFKENSYDVIVSYNLDTPQDALNGYSLREVFETYDVVDFDDFNNVNNAILNLTDNYLEVTHNGSQTYYATWKSESVLNGTWYANWELQSDDDLEVRFEMRFSSLIRSDWTDLNNTQDIVYDSYLFNGGYHTNAYIRFLSYDLNTFFKIYNVVLIDLTTLGINQTKDQMDYWYSEYKKLQENKIENYKLLGGEVETQWTEFNTEYLQPILNITGLYIDALIDPLGFFVDLLDNIVIIPTIG
jgi:hypothetical protein